VSYGSSELSPHASTRGTGLRIVARGLRSAPPETVPGGPVLHTWVVPDFVGGDWDDDFQEQGIWNKLLGVAVVLGVSGGFWTGVGFLIARLVR
jgi:hypothetical protein